MTVQQVQMGSREIIVVTPVSTAVENTQKIKSESQSTEQVTSSDLKSESKQIPNTDIVSSDPGVQTVWAPVLKCEYCQKPFLRQDHFKRHIQIHTGDKPFFCKLCGCSFTQKAELNRHCKSFKHVKKADHNYDGETCERRSFGVSDAETYTCAQCDRRFDRRDALNRHFGAAHAKK